MSVVFIALGLTQSSASRAQGAKGGPVTVSEVTTRASSNGTVVSIAADGPLSRAQTWQDREGYHVVVPAGAMRKAIKVGDGIKVTQMDHTIEILVQTRPGASVAVQPTSNHLNLAIDGKLDPRTWAPNGKQTSRSSVSDESVDKERKATVSRESVPVEVKASSPLASASGAEPMYISQVAASPSSESAVSQSGLQSPNGTTSAATIEGESSGYPLSIGLVIIVLGVVTLLFVRRWQGRAKVEAEFGWEDEPGFSDMSPDSSDNPEVKTGIIKSYGANGSGAQRKSVVRMPVAEPASLFGAFQVDQEVAKLVMGHPHKMEVLASRGLDDRRAIEASLLKALTSADEDERRRAREALEEYGFVARQCAAVLLAQDPYDRTSAARMLGEIKSPAALPFLLEALYDNESIVRNQAVLSIGELRLPSAIGALLDIARKQTDVPGALLSRVLSACSVEGLDFFDKPIPEPRLLSAMDTQMWSDAIKKLKPASVVEELPDSRDDERLGAALAKLESQEIVERSEGIKLLSQYAVRESVAALARVARTDAGANLRGLAISSLATINHESVFPSVLIGMADESREVRAAAARSLSRLSFDRADAYLRVMETDDANTLRDVAHACVKAGVAAQAIDRLGSGDRRQAYEALSVLSLLAKADVLDPVVKVIANHPSIEVRINAVRLLGTIGTAAVLEQLRQLAVDEMPEPVKTALAETIAELATDCKEVSGSEDGHEQHEMDSVQWVPEPLEHFAAENAHEPQKIDSLGCVSKQPETEDFEADSEELVRGCLECVPEKPAGESSGLPAPRIA